MLKEIGLGSGLAGILYFVFQGYNILPFLFLGVIIYFFYRMMKQKGALGNNFSKSDFSISQRKNITFNQIGGQKTAKNELLEALDFFKKLDSIKHLGIRPLTGILLSGPPGTGKTLLARAAANYTESVFLSASGSEFIEMYAGVGAQRVRKLFQKAKNMARKKDKDNAIIFIDEIDILGNKRGSHSSHLEYDQTLNQLLVEMDGMDISDEVKVLLIGATNRIEAIDKALMRPGRFDRIVNVNLPDKKGRKRILEIHTSNKPLADDVDLDKIAKETFSFSGAHLENVANEAAIMALREESSKIANHHFHEAVEKVMMGEKLDRRPQKEEMYRIAVHETGHAVVSELLRPESVSSVSLTSRGSALGYVRHVPEDDLYLQTENYLKDQISILVSGSCAEEILLNNKSTGAVNDFKKAVKYAGKIIYGGMSYLGIVSPEVLPEKLLHEAMNKIINNEEKRVQTLINDNKEIIGEIVEMLYSEERVDGKHIRQKLNNSKAVMEAG